ncbi:unnamed protein product, partial [Ectocarpus sp. 13 AM-2016]
GVDPRFWQSLAHPYRKSLGGKKQLGATTAFGRLHHCFRPHEHTTPHHRRNFMPPRPLPPMGSWSTNSSRPCLLSRRLRGDGAIRLPVHRGLLDQLPKILDVVSSPRRGQGTVLDHHPQVPPEVELQHHRVR